MKPSGIGGQAVIEGIMMRNRDVYAVAVRKPNKEIEIKREKNSMFTEKYKFLNFPIVRGVFNFVDSLVMGIKTLTYSSSFYEDEEDSKDTKVDEVGRKIFKDRFEAVVMAATVLFSIALAVAIFMVLPYLISRLLSNIIVSKTVLNLVEGIIRIAIFIVYMLLISLMKDIKRVFMYHGAEHKCINCIENGLELNVANVRKSSREHKRCGTSFMLLVMFVSVVFFIFIHLENPVLQVVVRLLLVPVIAGVSYEIIRFAGRNDNAFVNIISKPGMWMQKLSTKEPDDDMIEVAIKAVEAVFDWRDFLAKYDTLEDYPCAKKTKPAASGADVADISEASSRKIKVKRSGADSALKTAKADKAGKADMDKTGKRISMAPAGGTVSESVPAGDKDRKTGPVQEEAKAARPAQAKAVERELKEARREMCIARMEEELTKANYDALPDALADSLEEENSQSEHASSMDAAKGNSNPLAEHTEEFVMDIPTFKKRDKKNKK